LTDYLAWCCHRGCGALSFSESSSFAWTHVSFAGTALQPRRAAEAAPKPRGALAGFGGVGAGLGVRLAPSGLPNQGEMRLSRIRSRLNY